MTLPRGETHWQCIISTHILTKRMTQLNTGLAKSSWISTHILTKRMTLRYGGQQRGSGISTHILTKRMTLRYGGQQRGSGISTHILTKRMTCEEWGFKFWGIFQLTSSRRGWPKNDYLTEEEMHFNSHPHEEDDNYTPTLQTLLYISTHILTKRMTMKENILVKQQEFQLTSSRRGWLSAVIIVISNFYFNSHPHEEDDFFSVMTCPL